MKKFLAWLGGIIGIMLLLLVAVLVLVYVITNQHMHKVYPLPAASIQVPQGAAALAEGQRLFVSRSCADCHGKDLGGVTFINDAMIGQFTGTNLTRGKGGVGGELRPEDLVRGIRYGLASNGLPLRFMPSADFYYVSDDELGNLIAYIQSVPAVARVNPPLRVGPLARVLYLQGSFDLLPAETVAKRPPQPPQVPVGETVAFGEHLAHTCSGCHGAGFSGGPIPGTPPDWPPAQNITPDPVTGIGKWTQQQFMTALREGKRPDGTALAPQMPWPNLKYMTDTEINALWMYLRTVPPRPFGNH
ncbi:MAG TPA: c-type cytochrome [bacterium]|nr:c-type cytochrome [bacterium]